MLLAYQGWRMSMSLKYRSLVSADTCVLQALARTPYADCRELMALSGRHSRLVEEAVERLHTHRLIRFVWYANAEGWWVRRWFVTSWGAIYLSMLDGADLETVAEDNPVSLWWQRRLVERLEQVRSIYRVVQDAATASAGDPVGWRWYREGLVAGVMTVGDRRQFGVVLRGRTATADELAQVVRQVGYLQRDKNYPDVLMLVPGELEAQRVVADSRAESASVHVASVDSLLESRFRKPVWKRYGADAETIADVLRHRGERGSLDADFTYGTADELLLATEDEVMASEMPRLILPSGALLSTELSTVSRRLMHLLYDWPLIRTESLAELAGVAVKEAADGLDSLIAMDLAESVRVGRKRGSKRFALSAGGLSRLATLDGTDGRRLVREWTIGEDATGQVADGRKGRPMAGTQMRHTLRNLNRIDKTHRLVSLMRAELWRQDGWRMVQALPWHRWNRRLKGSARVFAPYATMQVSYEGRQHNFFIEVDEARSVTPELQRRLGDYQRYLQSDVATSDFEGQGAVMLVVLPDSAAVQRFSDVVVRKFRQSVPMFATSWDALRSGGALGWTWRNPWGQRTRGMSLKEVCYGMRWGFRRRLAL